MRGYAIIALDNPKTSINIGSVLRCGYNFGVASVIVSGHRRYHRAPTDTVRGHSHLPLFHVDDFHSAIPFDCIPVAVDLVEGATSLIEYKHPERAMYIFGAEDATLGKRILSFCRDVVYIPTNHCMNLAATVHVVMYDRLSKSKRENNHES